MKNFELAAKRGRLLLWCVLGLTSPGIAAPQNLLKNPDFEVLDGAGGFASWSAVLDSGAYAGPARTVSSIQGERSLELCCPQVLQSGAVMQRCMVDPRKYYMFGGLFLGRSGYVRVNCYDAKGCFRGCAVQIDLTVEPDTTAWSARNRRFALPPETTHVDVIFDMWARVCKGSGYADSLYLGEALATAPGRPVVVGRRTDDGIALSWNSCANVNSYLVYRSYFPDRGTGEAVAMVSGNSWTDRAVDVRASKCHYRVAALDAACQANFSGPVEVKVRDFPSDVPVAVVVCSPFIKVRRQGFLPVGSECIELDLAKNETASCQIVLNSPGRAVANVSVSVGCFEMDGQVLSSSQARVELFREEYLTVDSSHVMRESVESLPGQLPDPLLPWTDGMTVARGMNQGIWLKLRTGKACPAGTLRSAVTVRADGKTLAVLPLKATVHDFALPDRPSYPSSVQVRYDRIREAFGFAGDSERSRGVIDRYVEMLLDHRLNPLHLPYAWNDERCQRMLHDPRLRSLGLPTSDFSRLSELQARLRNEYDIEGYVYVEDEPGEGDFQRCRDTAALVHRHKGVPYLLTTAPHPELVGSVDIWVPSLQDIDWNQVGKRRTAGERIWWYTSLVPRSPFPTFLIEDCGVAPRALAWLQAKYRIEGLLYWDICMHRRLDDPDAYDGQVWDTPRLYREGNGDGFLVYPGKQRGIDGPVTSIRLETILEGNEELEYLAMYRRLLHEKGIPDVDIIRRVEGLVDPAAQSLTQWSVEPEAFDRQRRKLVVEILRLLRER